WFCVQDADIVPPFDCRDPPNERVAIGCSTRRKTTEREMLAGQFVEASIARRRQGKTIYNRAFRIHRDSKLCVLGRFLGGCLEICRNEFRRAKLLQLTGKGHPRRLHPNW